MVVSAWMSWEGGVDLTAMTEPKLEQPNLIVHVARMVHTPVGSAPSGMILYQPDPTKAPTLFGFVSHSQTVGKYFGPRVFAGTPFEQAPVSSASIEILTSGDAATAFIKAGGIEIRVRLDDIDTLLSVDRAPGPGGPFHQHVIEGAAASVTVEVDGKNLPVYLPLQGIGGGSPAVFTPAGMYSR